MKIAYLIFKRLVSSVTISKTKMNMNKCYLRKLCAENTMTNEMHITFLYEINENNIRQFNLTRKSEENIQNIAIRIAANIQKVINKVNKKKATDITGNNIKFYDNFKNLIANDITCDELFNMKSPISVNIIDQSYEIIRNAPWIVSFSLPQSILVGFPVYPINVVMHFTDKKASEFKWYTCEIINEKGNKIADQHYSWVEKEITFPYVPTVTDIGKKLKLEITPSDGVINGPKIEVISKNVIEAGPGACPFETRHLFTKLKLSGTRFRCVSYNILADLYCDSDFTRTVLHPYCPSYALHIDYRKQLLVKEILGYNADIISLQEVDNKIFNNTLNPIFEDNGYEGVFTKKGKQVAEGLSCLFRRDRFKLLNHNSIVFSESLPKSSCFETIWNAIKNNERLVERILDRSTVGSATLLQSLEFPNELLLIGNTHLYFHPNADHIRLIQGAMNIYWLKELLTKTRESMPMSRVSLILNGDFNSVPSCGIYSLYVNGEAPQSLSDWKSCEVEAVENLSLTQDTQLESACGTPLYTNFTAGFADCLDYIFYEKNNLKVEQVIPFPSNEELTQYTALPSIVFPSDHIAVVADLQFRD